MVLKKRELIIYIELFLLFKIQIVQIEKKAELFGLSDKNNHCQS